MPVGTAIVDLLPGGSGFKSHEGVGEIVADVVVLRGKVIRLWFAFLTNQRRLLRILVHVVRNGPHVIEELGVDGPLSIFVPDRRADQGGAAFVDGIEKGKAFATGHNVG